MPGMPVWEARDLVSLYDSLVESLEEPKEVEFEVRSTYSRTYWLTEYDEYEVYELNDDQRELLLDLVESLSSDIRSLKILERLPEILLKSGALSRVEPVRRFYDGSADDSSAYEERVELYRVKTPFVVVRRVRRTGEGEKMYVYWQFDGNDSEFFLDLDAKADEVIAFCNLGVSREKVTSLLERGYEVERAGDVVLTVGGSSTSIAEWRAYYEVLCGEVHEEVVDEADDEWGVRRKVRIVPDGRAVIRYFSGGTLGSWQSRKIYLMGG